MSKTSITEADFLINAPKSEVHIHVEGCIEPGLLFEIANRNGVELPYKTPEDILAMQTSKKSNSKENLKNFLDCLDLSREALRTSEDYFDIADKMLNRLHKDNVVYTEVFFDPQQGMRQGLQFDAIIEGLQQAQKKAQRALGLQSQWVMCFQRDYPAEEAFGLLDMAESHREFVVGVGLDNFEVSGFTRAFEQPFQVARDRGYKLTSHCDVNQPETYENIKGCIERLGVSRIDHGLNVVQFPDLLEIVVEKQIALTGCATFYASETAPHKTRIAMFRELLEKGALISVNSDDPSQFGSGWINKCLTSLQAGGGFTREQMMKFMENSFRSTWLPEKTQNEYIARLRAYAESL